MMTTKAIPLSAARDIVRSEKWTGKVRHEHDTGCMVWIAAKTHGYGVISLEGGAFRAHRVALVAASNADIPAGLVVDHLCGNTACVNPKHLEVVSQRVNILRAETSAPAQLASRAECGRGHAFVAENLRPGAAYRDCLTCRRESHQAIALAAARLGLSRRQYLAIHGHSAKTARAIVAALGATRG